MSSIRLTFLYPPLFRAASRPVAAAGSRLTAAAPSATAAVAKRRRQPRHQPGTRRWKGSFAPRHGKAIEPATLVVEQKEDEEIAEIQQEISQDNDRVELNEQDESAGGSNGTVEADRRTAGDTSAGEKEGAILSEEKAEDGQSADESAGLETTHREEKDGSDEWLEQKKAAERSLPGSSDGGRASIDTKDKKVDAEKSAVSESNDDEPPASASSSSSTSSSEEPATEQSTIPKSDMVIPEAATPGGPLEAIMHMPPPAEMEGRIGRPSMKPPRYVHHFDSYTLVKQLQEGNFTPHQAITFMKGIRKLLAEHLDVAQESLVSKSDVENETYLFRAACSELSTEIRNNRRLNDEHLRQQRTQLQHEVDNLTQTLNQELMTLNDTVKGLFNDRRMTASEEQRAVDSAIQQINYKMSIMLSSDSKSEIEGVRWILIRRSVLGIIFMAILTLATLRYASYVGHERKKEAEREKHREEELKRDGGKSEKASAADVAVALIEGG